MIGPNTASDLRTFIAQAETYEASLELPTEERVENMVARLSVATAKRRISRAEAGEVIDLYWRVLREVPLVDLAAAFDDLLKTATFMPKPAEVYAAANRYTGRRRYRISRARYLVWKHEIEWRPPVVPIDPAEILALTRRAAHNLQARCSGGEHQQIIGSSEHG